MALPSSKPFNPSCSAGARVLPKTPGAGPARLSASDLAAAAAFICLAGWAWWCYRHFQCDDAFIAYRYVNNLLHGRGWVYNPGERVNGATSPLHILVITLLARLIGDIPTAAHFLGALCLASAAWLCYRLLARAGTPEGGLAAGLLLATSPFLLSTFGMETMLYLALAAAALYWYHTRRLLLSAAALGLLIVTRPDGILLALVLLLHSLIARRRFPLAPAALAAALALPWFVFSTRYFGSPWPNTFAARMAQGAAGYNIEFFQGAFFWAGFSLRQSLWYFALLPCAIAGTLALALWARPYLPLLLWPAVYFLAYSLLGVPYQHWYYAPVLLGLIAASALWPLWIENGKTAPRLRSGWGEAERSRSPAPRLAFLWALLLLFPIAAGNLFLLTGHDCYLRLRSERSWQTIHGLIALSSAGVWLPLSIALLAAAAAWALRRRPRMARWALAAAVFLPVIAAQTRLNYLHSLTFPTPQIVAYREVGTWLNRRTSPDATVAAWEIGAIGYYSDRPILDYLGLITPEARAAVARRDFKWWLRQRPPDYVVVRDPPGGFEQAALDDPLFSERYRPAVVLRSPNWLPMTIHRRAESN